MIAAVALPAASKLVGKVFGNQHPDDPARLEANANAYRLGLEGNRDAFLFLKGMSGRFGELTIGAVPGVTNGGPASGWATQKAEDDAFKKYQALKPTFEPTVASGDATTVAPTVGGASPKSSPLQAGGWLMGLLVVGLLIGSLGASKHASAAA